MNRFVKNNCQYRETCFTVYLNLQYHTACGIRSFSCTPSKNQTLFTVKKQKMKLIHLATVAVTTNHTDIPLLATLVYMVSIRVLFLSSSIMFRNDSQRNLTHGVKTIRSVLSCVSSPLTVLNKRLYKQTMIQ